MTKPILLLSCLLFAVSAGAQTIASQADSLLKRLHNTSSYNEKLELLGNISDVYSYADSARAIYYALEIKKLAEEKRDQRGIGIAYYRLGGAYLEAGDPDRAEKSYLAAEDILAKDSSRQAQLILARTWANHGLVHQRRGNSEGQLKVLLEKAIPINEKLKDSANLGKNYHYIGIIFQNIRDYKKAIDYFKQSQVIFRPTPWVPEVKDNYIKIAESMIFLDVDTTLRDSTLGLLRQAERLIKEYPDPISEMICLQTKGLAAEYFDDNPADAEIFYRKAFDLAQRNSVTTVKTVLLSRLYYIKEKQGKFREALAIADTLYNGYKDFITPRDKLLLLRHMMDMEENLGNVKASLALYKIFTRINDSIQAANTSVKVQELEQKYAAKEKETQIIKLNQVAREQQLQIQQNRLWLYLLAVAILFLAGFFIARQIINRNRHKIAMQEAELLQQRIEKMKQEQHISYYAAMVEGQEQERKRLAIDLHDGLGGALSGIRLKMSKMIRDEETRMSREGEITLPAQGGILPLKKVADELDRSINDLRHIARNMMPEALLRYGLVAAIKDFCKSMESDAVKITFQSYNVQNDLPQSTQVTVFRIFQELITNAVKHAEASHILAQCLQQNGLFSITVEDNGKGFDTAASAPGIGLNTLRNRVHLLDGSFDIQSERGVGTTINIECSAGNEQQH